MWGLTRITLYYRIFPVRNKNPNQTHTHTHKNVMMSEIMKTKETKNYWSNERNKKRNDWLTIWIKNFFGSENVIINELRVYWVFESDETAICLLVFLFNLKKKTRRRRKTRRRNNKALSQSKQETIRVNSMKLINILWPLYNENGKFSHFKYAIYVYLINLTY